VTQKRWLSPHWKTFIEAAQTIGIERNPDYNGASQDGASLFADDDKGGRRLERRRRIPAASAEAEYT